MFFVDMKQRDWQIFLQERWIYSGSEENCNSGSATMASHVQVPGGHEKENASIGSERKLGGL